MIILNNGTCSIFFNNIFFYILNLSFGVINEPKNKFLDYYNKNGDKDYLHIRRWTNVYTKWFAQRFEFIG